MHLRRKRGFIVLMLVFFVLSLTLSSVLVLFSRSMGEYRGAVFEAGHTKAKVLAQSGLETAILVLNKVPVDQLAAFGVFSAPLALPLGDGVISLAITEESGRININRLVHFFDDEVDLRTREMLDRLAISFSLPPDMWDGVVDYIDENSTPMPRGFESRDYAMLNPPRKIKNGRLDSLEELLLIPGFDKRILYDDLRSQERKKNTSNDFSTDEEKLAISDADFVLANNLTVALPNDPQESSSDKINLNTAPYHVVLALSAFMTPEIAKKIIVARLKKGGRFRNMSEVQQLVPELSQRTTGSATLLQELDQRVTFSDRLYKIVAEASLGSQTAHVIAYFDPVARKITTYLE